MNTNSNSSNRYSENNTAESIAKLLAQAANELDKDTVTALLRARNVALEKQSRREPVFTLRSEYGIYRLTHQAPRQWAAILILLATLVISATSYWHHLPQHDLNDHDASYLDIAILTDDLPIEIFVD